MAFNPQMEVGWFISTKSPGLHEPLEDFEQERGRDFGFPWEEDRGVRGET